MPPLHSPTDDTVLRAVLARLLQQDDIALAQTQLNEWSKEQPDNINLQYYKAYWAYRAQQYNQAIPLFQRVRKNLPHTSACLHFSSSDADYFMGLAQYQSGQYLPAIETFLTALQQPDLSTASQAKLSGMLGLVHNACGHNLEAKQYLTQATTLEPEEPLYWENLGYYYDRLYEFESAKFAYAKALQLISQNSDPSAGATLITLHLHLARVLAQLDKWDASQQEYAQVLHLQPSLPVILEAATQLPQIYDDTEQMHACRDQYIEQLLTLLAQPPMLPPNEALAQLDQLYNSPVFALPYQGENDKDLMAGMGQLLTRWIEPESRLTRKQLTPVSEPLTRPLRIGFISRNFRPEATVGKLYLPLVAGLAKQGIECVLFHIQPHFHPTQHAGWQQEGHITRGHLPCNNTALAVRILEQAELDIAFYPDVSTDPSAMLMALHRVAPKQCTSWGHAVTSGLPGMDAYLSSTWLEPEDAEEHYTESLICLNSLPTLYIPPTKSGGNKGPSLREAACLPEDAVVYFCPQSLFKLHPEFDGVLKGLLNQDPDGHVVLIDDLNAAIKARLMERFKTHIGLKGLSRVHIAPRCTPETFLHWLHQANVLLDPIHFGGGNTTLEALAIGTPIITWPGTYMRSRITAGCYQAMQCAPLCEALIAKNIEDYIEKAMRTAHDTAWRTQCQTWIEKHNHRLWDEDIILAEFIRAFQDLFTQ